MSPENNKPQGWPSDSTDASQPNPVAAQPIQPTSNDFNATDQSNLSPQAIEPSQPTNSGVPSEQSWGQQTQPMSQTNTDLPTPATSQPLQPMPAGQFNQQPFAPVANPQPIGKAKFWTKPKKIIAGVVAASIIALSVGTAAAYALYVKPENVLNAAMLNLSTADTLKTTGKIVLKNAEQVSNESFTLDFKTENNQTATKADINMDVKIDALDTSLSAGLVTDDKNDLYFKFGNLQESVNALLEESGLSDLGDFQTAIDALVESLDDQWIRVDSETMLDELSDDEKKSYECSQTLIADIKKDDALINGVYDRYKEHSFVVPTKLDSQSISTAHYKITVDAAKAESFVSSLKDTELFKRLKNCDDTVELSTDNLKESIDELNKQNIEVWIDRSSRTMQKMLISGTDEDTIYEMTVDMISNEQVSISAPADSKSVDEIIDEFTNVVSEAIGGSDFQTFESTDDSMGGFDDSGEDSVLGARSLRLLEMFQ